MTDIDTALYETCCAKPPDASLLASLLAEGANPNVDHYNVLGPLSPLCALIEHYEPAPLLENIKLILEKGAEINYQSKTGLTALISAAIYDHVDIARYLLTVGANPNLQYSRTL